MLPADARTLSETAPGVSPLIAEPIRETIMRDVRNVGEKLQYVLSPSSRQEKGGILKEWDFWGPLLLCLALSIILWSQAASSQKSYVFALVFILTWGGAAVVTLNASLLGSSVPFFQSICVLGYSMFPLIIAAAVCLLIPDYLGFIRLVPTAGGIYYALGASTSFLGSSAAPEKKGLVLYPLFLFYVMLGWLVVVM